MLSKLIALLLSYPANLLVYVLERPLIFAAWLVLGITVLIIATRLRRTTFRKLWIALWFMPAVVGWALMPWPFGIATMDQDWVSVASLFLCAAVNTVIVFGIAAAWRRLRNRDEQYD